MTSERIAVVTGGDEGVGLRICRELSLAGAQVVLTSCDEGDGAKAVRTLDNEGHSILYVQLDPYDIKSIDRAVGFVAGALERADILVNAHPPGYGSGWDISSGNPADELLSLEPAGMLQTTRRFVQLMHAKKYGRVVNISSSVALNESAGSMDLDHIVYTAINEATRVLANESNDQQTDIKVNAVCLRPGKRHIEKDVVTVTQLALLPPEGPTGTIFMAGESVKD